MIATESLGIYADIEDAFAKIMRQNEEKVYYPEKEKFYFMKKLAKR